MPLGHDDAQFFRNEGRLTFPADSGGVEEAIKAAFAFGDGVNGVARGSRLRRNNGALFTYEAIQESRFSDVRAADDCHVYFRRRLCRFTFCEGRLDHVKKIIEAETMLG